MISIDIKYILNLILLFGVISILSVVTFANTNVIPIGEMAYQELWLGRTAIVFAVCSIICLCFTRKYSLSFSLIVTWVFIILGGIECIWGLKQIYGLSVSNHSLFSLTGSFYNPGPYSGYLAMIFPLCLHKWLILKKKTERTWIIHLQYNVALGVMLLIICVLPSGMSRSSWVAAAISGMWVYFMQSSLVSKLKTFRNRYKKSVVLSVSVIACIIIIITVYALFHLKESSANGRLFMWKISTLAIAESPIVGHGTGNFVSAYGRAQENYFANSKYSETEEFVAGSPEHAFNEYLQVAVEYGIPFLLVILLVIAFCLWRGCIEGNIGICGSIISVLIFGFSSYPMQIPGFAISFYFLLASCLVGRSNIILMIFTVIMILTGIYYQKNNQYDACKEWYSAKMFYNIGAYEAAKEGYEKLHSDLWNKGSFLFEYGHCLHNLKEYRISIAILQESLNYSCDPMILNIIGKNYQALREYKNSEEYLIRSTHLLPGRIYPYYLLAKLYSEPDFRQETKMKRNIEVVLTKEPKVQSTAVKEMRKEVKKMKYHIPF